MEKVGPKIALFVECGKYQGALGPFLSERGPSGPFISLLCVQGSAAYHGHYAWYATSERERERERERSRFPAFV